MDDYSDFSKTPKAFSLHKSDKENDAKYALPRDVLVSLLRDIDCGMKVTGLVIAFQLENSEGQKEFSWRNATDSVTTSIGMLERTKINILTGY